MRLLEADRCCHFCGGEAKHYMGGGMWVCFKMWVHLLLGGGACK